MNYIPEVPNRLKQDSALESNLRDCQGVQVRSDLVHATGACLFLAEMNGFRAGPLPLNPAYPIQSFVLLSNGMDTSGDDKTLATLASVLIGSAREVRMMFKSRARVVQRRRVHAGFEVPQNTHWILQKKRSFLTSLDTYALQ